MQFLFLQNTQNLLHFSNSQFKYILPSYLISPERKEGLLGASALNHLGKFENTIILFINTETNYFSTFKISFDKLFKS